MEVIEGRDALLSLSWQGAKPLHILAVYAPSSPRANADFWKELYTLWTRRKFPKINVLLGDFNMAEEGADRLPPHPDNPECTQMLRNFCSCFQLIDGWCRSNPDKLGYTFLQPATAIHSIIDCIYLNNRNLLYTHDWKIEPSPIETDHCVVVVKILNPTAPYTRKGRWTHHFL